MACASAFHSSIALRQCFSSSRRATVTFNFPFHSISRSTLVLARPRNSGSAISSSNKNKRNLPRRDQGKEEDLDDDAFEALFKQLEEDLKSEDPSIDDTDDEISEEDLAMLERELTEALQGDDIELFNLAADAIDNDDHDVEEGDVEEGDAEEDDAEEDNEPVKLKYWQLRRLASALKIGRRKTSIKSLAEELCLDRAVVLDLLRDPPPSLLMMSATLADEPAPAVVSENKPMQIIPTEATVSAAEAETKVKVHVHVMQQGWSAQKRLKKVHLDTLERVYRRTKRPTNTMISSIVQVTNLPRKRVVKWFEDKRGEDGVPENRQPYQRTVSNTIT